MIPSETYKLMNKLTLKLLEIIANSNLDESQKYKKIEDLKKVIDKELSKSKHNLKNNPLSKIYFLNTFKQIAKHRNFTIEVSFLLNTLE